MRRDIVAVAKTNTLMTQTCSHWWRETRGRVNVTLHTSQFRPEGCSDFSGWIAICAAWQSKQKMAIFMELF